MYGHLHHPWAVLGAQDIRPSQPWSSPGQAAKHGRMDPRGRFCALLRCATPNAGGDKPLLACLQEPSSALLWVFGLNSQSTLSSETGENDETRAVCGTWSIRSETTTCSLPQAWQSASGYVCDIRRCPRCRTRLCIDRTSPPKVRALELSVLEVRLTLRTANYQKRAHVYVLFASHLLANFRL